MFSGLNQGSRVYILNKTNGIEFKIGEVVGTTTPVFATDGTNMMVVNLKVKVDGSNVDYDNSFGCICADNNKKIIKTGDRGRKSSSRYNYRLCREN